MPKTVEYQQPVLQAEPQQLECVLCAKKAALLHKGTSYCRQCYDANNKVGKLVN